MTEDWIITETSAFMNARLLNAAAVTKGCIPISASMCGSIFASRRMRAPAALLEIASLVASGEWNGCSSPYTTSL